MDHVCEPESERLITASRAKATTFFDRSLLSEWPLLSFERFLICAVRNIWSHLDCFLVQGDRVSSKLLKVEYAAEKHVAPLNQPPLRISCRVVDRLGIELDGCFEPIVLSLDL